MTILILFSLVGKLYFWSKRNSRIFTFEELTGHAGHTFTDIFKAGNCLQFLLLISWGTVLIGKIIFLHYNKIFGNCELRWLTINLHCWVICGQTSFQGDINFKYCAAINKNTSPDWLAQRENIPFVIWFFYGLWFNSAGRLLLRWSAFVLSTKPLLQMRDKDTFIKYLIVRPSTG